VRNTPNINFSLILIKNSCIFGLLFESHISKPRIPKQMKIMPIPISIYVMLSISPVLFFVFPYSLLRMIPNHPSTLSVTLFGIIFRFEMSDSPCKHISTLAGIKIAKSGIWVRICIVFISINIYFIARPRTPARIIFPARDPVRDDSINFTD
jgi:hypothetical protein